MIFPDRCHLQKIKYWRSVLPVLCLFLISMFCGCAIKPTSSSRWVSLFNGKNLDGWKVKITGYDLNDNFGDTFRVEDGILKVSYDQYDKFDGRFGHIFYDGTFSHYILRLEYRFVGEQCPGGPGWAFRNSGIMAHGQSPESMKKDQDFPNSIEAARRQRQGQTPNRKFVYAGYACRNGRQACHSALYLVQFKNLSRRPMGYN